VIEEDLRNLSLFAPAQGLRERVLGATRRARVDQRLGRWILGSALASVLIAGFTSRMVDSDPAPEALLPADLEANLLAELHLTPDELRVRGRWLIPPTPNLEELFPWLR
jgi:hypothetical protein